MSCSAPAPLETLTIRAGRAGAQERQDGLRHAPGAEEVRLERLADLVEVGVDAALPGVVEDRRVVDEHVEALEPPRPPRARSRRRRRRATTGLMGRRRAGARPARRLAGSRAPRSTVVAELRELAADLEADAAIGAGDERDAGRGQSTWRIDLAGDRGGRGGRGWRRPARASSPRGRCAGRGGRRRRARAGGRASRSRRGAWPARGRRAGRRCGRRGRGRRARAWGTRRARSGRCWRRRRRCRRARRAGSRRRARGRRRPRRSTSNSGPSGVSSWMTSSAPRSVRPRARSGLAETAVTCAPPMWASWTAKRPTPPLAPVTSTRRRDRVAADVERQQRGDPGDGQRRGLGEAHRVGQDGDARASAPRRAAPTPCRGRADDAGALGRAAAVGGRRGAPSRRGPSR